MTSNKDSNNSENNDSENSEESEEKKTSAFNDADEAEKQKDFYLNSLLDLEEEYEADEIDEKNYKKLKSAYTKRASRAIAGKPVVKKTKNIPFYKRGVILLMAFVLLLGGVSGTVLALTSGQRSSNDEATGDVRASSASLLDQANATFDAAVQGGQINLAQVEMAISLFDQVLEENPSNLEALRQKSFAQFAAGRTDEANDTIQVALNINPENVETLSYVISLNLVQGFYSVAEQHLETIETLNISEEELAENNISALRLRVYRERLEADYAGANLNNYPESIGQGLTVPTKFADFNLPSPEFGFELVNAFLNLLSDSQTNPQSDLQQEDIPTVNVLVVTILDTLANEVDELFSETSQKVEVLLRHTFIFAGSPGLFPYGGEINNSGFESIQKAIDLMPTDANIWRQRADLYSFIARFIQQNDGPDYMEIYDLAFSDINKAIELEPDNPENLLGKVSLLLQTEAFIEAEMLATEILATSPEDAQTYFLRGISYFEQESYDAALADINTSLSLLESQIAGLQAVTQRDVIQERELQTLRSLQNSADGLRGQIEAAQQAESESTTTTTSP